MAQHCATSNSTAIYSHKLNLRVAKQYHLAGKEFNLESHSDKIFTFIPAMKSQRMRFAGTCGMDAEEKWMRKGKRPRN
jgi:hypothetical protein